MTVKLLLFLDAYIIMLEALMIIVCIPQNFPSVCPFLESACLSYFAPHHSYCALLFFSHVHNIINQHELFEKSSWDPSWLICSPTYFETWTQKSLFSYAIQVLTMVNFHWHFFDAYVDYEDISFHAYMLHSWVSVIYGNDTFWLHCLIWYKISNYVICLVGCIW